MVFCDPFPRRLTPCPAMPSPLPRPSDPISRHADAPRTLELRELRIRCTTRHGRTMAHSGNLRPAAWRILGASLATEIDGPACAAPLLRRLRFGRRTGPRPQQGARRREKRKPGNRARMSACGPWGLAIYRVALPACWPAAWRLKSPELLGVTDFGQAISVARTTRASPVRGSSHADVMRRSTSSDPACDRDTTRSGKFTSVPAYRHLTDLLARADGSMRTRDEAVAEFGPVTVRFVELTEALLAVADAPFPLSVPPRVFISYRWGTENDNRWVAAVATELERRGNIVIYDRTDSLAKDDVPRFVASIASCHVFLAIIDHRYLHSVNIGVINNRAAFESDPDIHFRGTWVFDEITAAAMVSHGGNGVLREIGLLRAGTRLPRGFHLRGDLAVSNTLDARYPSLLRSAMDRYLTPRTPCPDQRTSAEAESVLHASYLSLRADDLGTARDAAVQARTLVPALADPYLRLGQVELAARDWRALHEVAVAGRRVDDTFADFRLWIALAQAEMGNHRAAVRDLVSLVRCSRLGTKPRAVLADCFDELGQHYASIAHYEMARRSDPLSSTLNTNLGRNYQVTGQPEKALEALERAFRDDRGSLPTCVILASVLIEAGAYERAGVVLSRIPTGDQGDGTVQYLKDVLARTSASAVEPPTVWQRPARPMDRVLRCTSCGCSLPIPLVHSLCISCGAEQAGGGDACDYCGSSGLMHGQLQVEGSGLACPFCSSGRLELRGLREDQFRVAPQPASAGALRAWVDEEVAAGRKLSYWQRTEPCWHTSLDR